ncbi:MAG: cobalbumin biosynthesis enzyme [Dehalococcoidia bacterium]|nr:cobalbumin biosynthesis enzyme [Dehalococcoidia bacterium]
MNQKLVLVLGGDRSGKSQFAVTMASRRSSRVLFVATAEPGDEEMHQRILAHKRSRPVQWRTLEAPTDIGIRLAKEIKNEEVVIVDCLGLLVSNLLGKATDLVEPAKKNTSKAQKFVDGEVKQLLKTILEIDTSFIIVSNEVGMGLVPDNRLGRIYRDLLGGVNQKVAEKADEVYLLVAGLPWKLKG